MIKSLENKKIAVLCEGNSQEAAISQRSGQAITQGLKQLGYQATQIRLNTLNEVPINDFDIFFNSLHGGIGENGCLAALLEYHQKPFTSAASQACALCWHKPTFKQALKHLNIATANAYEATDDPESLTYPLIFKPQSGGSSINTHLMTSKADLKIQQKTYKKELNHFFLEDFIKGTEITVGLICQPNQVLELPVLELIPDGHFCDYETKYTAGKTTFVLPSKLPESIQKECLETAKTIQQHMKLSGLIRIDMIVKEDKPYVLECNTSPGMTEHSYVPAQAREANLSFEALLDLILQCA